MSDTLKDSSPVQTANNAQAKQNATSQVDTANGQTLANQNTTSQPETAKDMQDNANTIIPQTEIANDIQDNLNTTSQAETTNKSEDHQAANSEIQITVDETVEVGHIYRMQNPLGDKPLENIKIEHRCDSADIYHIYYRDVWYPQSKSDVQLERKHKKMPLTVKTTCLACGFMFEEDVDKFAEMKQNEWIASEIVKLCGCQNRNITYTLARMSETLKVFSTVQTANDAQTNQNATSQVDTANGESLSNQNTTSHAETTNYSEDNVNTISQAETANYYSLDNLNATPQAETTNKCEDHQVATSEIQINDIFEVEPIYRMCDPLNDTPLENINKKHNCNSDYLHLVCYRVIRFPQSNSGVELETNRREVYMTVKTTCTDCGFILDDDLEEDSGKEQIEWDGFEIVSGSEAELETRKEDADVEQEAEVIVKQELDLETGNKSEQYECDKISKRHSVVQSDCLEWKIENEYLYVN